MNNVKNRVESKLGTNRTMATRAEGAIITIALAFVVSVYAALSGGYLELNPWKLGGLLFVLVLAYVFCSKE